MNDAARAFHALRATLATDPTNPDVEIHAANLAASLASWPTPRRVCMMRSWALRSLDGMGAVLAPYGAGIAWERHESREGVHWVSVCRRYEPKASHHPYAGTVVRERVPA